VFERDYELRSLAKVEKHIAEVGHLPSVPSAEEIVATGLSLGDSLRIMLEKIEELTLYAIEKDKRVARLETRLSRLEQLLNQLED